MKHNDLVSHVFCRVDTSSGKIMPEIFVSVLAQGSTTDAFRVLVQGCLVTSSNVHSLLSSLRKQIENMENDIVRLYQTGYVLLANRFPLLSFVNEDHSDYS